MKAVIKSVSHSECVIKIDPNYSQSLSNLVDKDVEIEISKYAEKWSLKALRYAWHLTGELAKALGMSQEEMHFLTIKDYAPRYLVTLDIGEDIADYDIKYFEFEGYNGECAQYMAYKGFKELNSKQMAVVIDGLVQECNQQDIPTKSAEEWQYILEGWQNEESYIKR